MLLRKAYCLVASGLKPNTRRAYNMAQRQFVSFLPLGQTLAIGYCRHIVICLPVCLSVQLLLTAIT